MKNLKLLLGLIGLFIATASCANDSDTQNNTMRVFAKGTYTNQAARLGMPSNVIIINSFQANIRQLTFNYSQMDNNYGNNSINVLGKWELDLLNRTIPLTTMNLPNGVYGNAELRLIKCMESSSPMYHKTVEIRGTVDDQPFIFWHDFERILTLDYEDDTEDLVVNNQSLNVVLDFNLNKLFDLVDISTAVDGDGDGVIEIGPNDSDGNNEIFQQLDQFIGICGRLDDNR